LFPFREESIEMANYRRSAEKESYWRRQLEGQAASGLSVRRYCRERGLSEPSFYVWRKELQKRDLEAAAKTKAQKSRRVLSGKTGHSSLVAVDVIHVPASTATIEIAVPGGIVIRLRDDTSAETLGRVLTAVGCPPGVAATNPGSSREVESC
jgi:hypothetical protein